MNNYDVVRVPTLGRNDDTKCRRKPKSAGKPKAIHNGTCLWTIAWSAKTNGAAGKAGLLALSVLFLSACSFSQPSCSGDNVVAALRSIMERQHLTAGLRASFAEAASTVDYSLVNIVTVDHTDSRASCKASIEVKVTLKKGGTKTLPLGQSVEYFVERTDEGKTLVTAPGW